MNNIIRVRSQESGVRPVVSFCIPVYNNADAATRITAGILVSDDTRFEVIACDDASTDNAQELLTQIHDPRFRYIRNPKNLGAHKNWLHSLELGRSEWLYLVMGRDRIHGEKITHLIEYLDYARDNNITLIYDGYSKQVQPIIYSGIEAMLHFLDFWHPTGTIFSRQHFEAIPDKQYYFTHSDMYPENYIRRDLLLKGKGASIMSGVHIWPSVLIDQSKIQSTVEHSMKQEDMYYAPKRRTGQTHEIIDMIDSLPQGTFSIDDSNKFFRRKFYGLLLTVSVGWRDTCKNFVWQAHYGQKVRNVPIHEVLGNIITAYRATKSHIKDKGTFTPSRQRIMYLCLVKVLVKVLVYLPVKSVAKAILEPLGLWGVLRSLKRRITKSPA